MNDIEVQAIRHMYQSDPASFFGLAFRLLYPGVKYLPHWSTQLLGEALHRCFRRETKRLIINMPPRTLKSHCASVAFPAWALAVRPESKILCVAGHPCLAGEHHTRTRNLMCDPKYRAIFPHVRFSETARSINLPHGGSRSSFTLTGAITGHGTDMIIIDDPQAAHELEPIEREGVCEWYDRNIYQRLDDKKDGVVILVMQRVAHDDLTAHLLARGGWEHLNLPAIATEDQSFPGYFGERVLRKKGDALHPARESRDQLRAAMLQMGAHAFMAQYQQTPYAPHEGQGCSVFHIPPHPHATVEECKDAMLCFGLIPEEKFVLEKVFSEFSGIRVGPPPELTVEEWLERCDRSAANRGGIKPSVTSEGNP